MTYLPKGVALAAIALAAIMQNAVVQAEESLIELTHRGLDLAASPLSVESAEFTIGPQAIDLAYKLVNTTAEPLSLTLKLPFPEIDFSDPDSAWAIPGSDPVNFIDFRAKIDRKPATFSINQSATVDGKDVGATLSQHGLSLIPIGAFQNQLAALSPDARARLAKSGLIAQAGTDQSGAPLYFPRWTVHTTASKQVTVASAQSLLVDLRFRTSVGLMQDSIMREPLRSEKSLASEIQRRRADYCIDHAFLAGIDKIVSTAVAEATKPLEPLPQAPVVGLPGIFSDPAKPAPPAPSKPLATATRVFPEANVANLRERRIIFDIAAGAPATPIKSFRLSVDKGKPDRVVSFCLDNLKRISSTAFEMRGDNYQPSGVLKILFVGRN